MSDSSSGKKIDFSNDQDLEEKINQKIRMLDVALANPNIHQKTKYFMTPPIKNEDDEAGLAQYADKFEEKSLKIKKSNENNKKKYEEEIKKRIAGLEDFLYYYKQNDGHGAQVDPYLIGPIPHLEQYREIPEWKVKAPTQVSEEEASEVTDGEAGSDSKQPTQPMNLETDRNEGTEMQETQDSGGTPMPSMDLNSPAHNPQSLPSPGSPDIFSPSTDSQTYSEDHEALQELRHYLTQSPDFLLTQSPNFPLTQQPRHRNINISHWYIT